MIRSCVINEGRLVGRDLEVEALRIVRADKGLRVWVDLESPTPEETKLILEEMFAFHPLAIEDCVVPSGLPKVEDYDDHLFIVTQAVDFTRAEKFNTTELCMFLSRDFLVTFHRDPMRSITLLFDRFNYAKGTVAKGMDRVAHNILDNLVDLYKPVTDELRDEIEEIEARILKSEESETLINDLLDVRREVAHLRRIVRPQRDVINRLAHGETKIIRSVMLPYFRDIRDNLVRIDQTALSLADQLLVSFDLYLNKSASDANEGIKVLTALTAITLPPIVIGTWFGMNFERMPELESPYGYWAALGLMIVSTAGMFAWCKRRGWI